MEIEGTTLAEAEEFVRSLGRGERAMYDIQWDELAPSIKYLKGIRRDGKLVGITGVYRRWLVGISTFRVVKEQYWNQGIGTELVRQWVAWATDHFIPYTVRQGTLGNIAATVTYEKIIKPRATMTLNGIRYDIFIFREWATALIPVLLLLVWLHYYAHEVRRVMSTVRLPKVKLNSRVLKVAARFIDYEADHLSVESRMIEYGFVLGMLMRLPPGKALDVGCVALHNCIDSALAFAGWAVYGVDIRGDYGFQHPNFHFLHQDIRHSTLPDESFNVVVCVSVLEHVGVRGFYGVDIEDAGGDIAAATEILRMLKRGGKILFTAPYSKKYHLRPMERVYDADRLAVMFAGTDTIHRVIYAWREDKWEEIEAEIDEDMLLCLELQKR